MLRYDLKIFWGKWLFAWKINIPSVGFDKLWDKIKKSTLPASKLSGALWRRGGSLLASFPPRRQSAPKTSSLHQELSWFYVLSCLLMLKMTIFFLRRTFWQCCFLFSHLADTFLFLEILVQQHDMVGGLFCLCTKKVLRIVNTSKNVLEVYWSVLDWFPSTRKYLEIAISTLRPVLLFITLKHSL